MSLRDLARTLGLSITTVSRALAGYSDVALATRERVVREARRIGYEPNQIARHLRTGRSSAVGVVLPAEPGHFDDPFFLQFLAAMGRRLALADFDLLVTAARPGEEEIKVYRRLVEGRRVDGMVVARTRRKDERIAYLQDKGFPFVVHGRTETRRPYAFLDIDGAAAFDAATRRLADLGHRSIALINAPDHYMFAHFREQGWRGALADLGLAPGPIRVGEPTEENGFRLAQSLIHLPDRPTAILCGTDRLAVGALRALAQAGLRAGRDLELIGYDDLPVATYTEPALTTIAQPLARAGERLVEMLLAVLEGTDPAALQEIWPAHLVVRASDGPAPETTTQKDIATTQAKPPKGGKSNARISSR